MHSLRFCSLLVVFTLTSSVRGQEAAQSFEAPSSIDLRAPEYPLSAARRGEEGWVTLNFMVDSSGEIFEPTVIGSAGPDSFQRAAIRALSRSEFEPAKLDGRPVEGSLFYTYRFHLGGAALTARSSFQRDYSRMLVFIDSNNREEADKLLASMNEKPTRTNTEHALMNLTRFAHSENFHKNEIAQMEYLQNALMFESYDSENSAGYLPEDMRNFARHRLFLLQVNNHRYAEALKTSNNMRESGVNTESIEKLVEQIMELSRDDSSYVVKGATDNNGYWIMLLLKPGLHIDNLGNRISEFRLRCRNKYQFFSFQEGAQYQIPESWERCSLEILGDANIDFEVVQF